MTEPFLSPATAAKLSTDHPVGSRHLAILEIALDMIGNGWSENATFTKIRESFPAEKTDKEIWDAIRGAVAKNPQPAGFGTSHVNGSRRPLAAPPARQATEKAKSPQEMADWWLGGHSTTLEEFAHNSPVAIPPEAQSWPGLMFSHLYSPEECVNVVTKFTVSEKGKANPQGSGLSQGRDKWLAYFGSKGVPRSSAGAWMRPNPTKETGSGKDGAITDADITAFRFILIESDNLPIETQLAIYAKWKLPIAAVIHSGGDSAHAWVRVDAIDKPAYDAIAAKLFAMVQPFGFDRANKNASRLSRLPGAQREIGASGDGMQRLLLVNPDAQTLTEAALIDFEASLQFPLVEEKPFRSTFITAVNRYQELAANRSKLGIPTGIVGFDELTGGLKGGQMIVIAAATGGGKTTLATNILNTACRNKHGVALFTLEMDRDEIADLIVAINCSIDRNKFNHGRFSEHDFKLIAAHGEELAKLPLYISDEPTMTSAQIRSRTLQLHAEKKIGLIVVDYAQFVSCEAFKDNREQQVARISRDMRSLAKETKLPLILLSQLNEEGKLRESRVIAHDAHIVMLVEEDDTGNIIVKIVKGRSIPKGEYHMRFEKQYGRLTSIYQGDRTRNYDPE